MKAQINITITKEKLSAYCDRPDALDLSDQELLDIASHVTDAIFANNFWELCKIVLDEYKS